MMKCPKCDVIFDDNFKYCPECGSKLLSFDTINFREERENESRDSTGRRRRRQRSEEREMEYLERWIDRLIKQSVLDCYSISFIRHDFNAGLIRDEQTLIKKIRAMKEKQKNRIPLIKYLNQFSSFSDDYGRIRMEILTYKITDMKTLKREIENAELYYKEDEDEFYYYWEF